jgi:hypothetical protein
VTYGDDSGNRIFVLYWRCPLIRVSVIRGSTVLTKSVGQLRVMLTPFLGLSLTDVFANIVIKLLITSFLTSDYF